MADPQTTDSNSRENITAHEVGHGLIDNIVDITFPATEDKSLMWIGHKPGGPFNPCEIRDREWKRINPTPGDGLP